MSKCCENCTVANNIVTFVPPEGSDSPKYYFVGECPGCISGDSLIDVAYRDKVIYPQGIPIRDLVDKKEFCVYSFDVNLNKVVVGKAVKVWKTGYKPVFKVTYEWYKNSKEGRIVYQDSVKVTSNHRFLLRGNSNRGEYNNSKSDRYVSIDTGLCIGDSLEPFYRHFTNGYSYIGNRSYKTVKESRFLLKHKVGRESLSSKEQCRHIDGNKLNDSFDNLEYYYKYLLGRKKIFKNWTDEDVYKRFKTRFPECEVPNNHKIVSIEFCGYEDVYDIEVERYHNFACNGIFIHNSEEVKVGRPFVGPAGQILRAVINSLQLNPSDYRIFNAVACRAINVSGRNRNPSLKEIMNCSSILKADILKSKPEIIIALGKSAASAFVDISEYSTVSELMRHTFDFEGIPVKVAYHPSYIQRNGGVGTDLYDLYYSTFRRYLRLYDKTVDMFEWDIEPPDFVFELEKRFVNDPEIAFDVETNGYPFVSDQLEIIGFAFASRIKSYYILIKDLTMSYEWTKEHSEALRRFLLSRRRIWVYNMVCEYLCTVNKYNVDLDNLADTMQLCRVNNKFGSLKDIAQQELLVSDWSERIDLLNSAIDQIVTLYKPTKRGAKYEYKQLEETGSFESIREELKASDKSNNRTKKMLTALDTIFSEYNEEERKALATYLIDLIPTQHYPDVYYHLVPARIIGPYCCRDSQILFHLNDSLYKRMDDKSKSAFEYYNRHSLFGCEIQKNSIIWDDDEAGILEREYEKVGLDALKKLQLNPLLFPVLKKEREATEEKILTAVSIDKLKPFFNPLSNHHTTREIFNKAFVTEDFKLAYLLYLVNREVLNDHGRRYPNLSLFVDVSKLTAKERFSKFRQFLENQKETGYTKSELRFIEEAYEYVLPGMASSEIEVFYDVVTKFFGDDLEGDINECHEETKLLYYFRLFKKVMKSLTTYIEGGVGRGSCFLADLSNKTWIKREKSYLWCDDKKNDKKNGNDWVLQANYNINGAETRRWKSPMHVIPWMSELRDIHISRFGEDGVLCHFDYCLTGDTKIKISRYGANDPYWEWESVPIKDLIYKSEFYVHSFDESTKSIRTGTGHSCRMVRETIDLIKITLNNGGIVECTPEHKFMIDDSQDFVEAQNLKLLDSLTAIRGKFYNCIGEDYYNKISQGSCKIIKIERIKLDTPVKTYCFTVDEFHNFFLDSGILSSNSQAEVRTLAKLANEQSLIEAYKQGLDIHRVIAGNVFGKKPEDVTSVERRFSKAASFSILYGKGIKTFANDFLKGDVAKAEEMFRKLFTAYPGIKKFIDECHSGFLKTGSIPTIFGDHMLIKYNPNSRIDTARALRESQNWPVQSLSYEIPIPLLLGESLPIGKIAEHPDKDWYGWAVDKKTGQQVPVRLLHPQKTGEKHDWVKVTLDNGKTYETTVGHVWIMKDGSEKKAENLKVGDFLMPHYLYGKEYPTTVEWKSPNHKVACVEFVHYDEPKATYDLHVEGYENFAIGEWNDGVFIHNSSASNLAALGLYYLMKDIKYYKLMVKLFGFTHDSGDADIYIPDLFGFFTLMYRNMEDKIIQEWDVPMAVDCELGVRGASLVELNIDRDKFDGRFIEAEVSGKKSDIDHLVERLLKFYNVEVVIDEKDIKEDRVPVSELFLTRRAYSRDIGQSITKASGKLQIRRG